MIYQAMYKSSHVQFFIVMIYQAMQEFKIKNVPYYFGIKVVEISD